MNCSQSHELINHWNAKSGQQIEKNLRLHLEECELCHKFWQQHTLTGYLREIAHSELPVGLEDRILQKFEPYQRPQVRSHWRQFAIAASLLITLSFGFYTYRESSVSESIGFSVVEVTLGEVHNLRVMVSAKKAYSGATMTILLPNNIVLSGYQGVTELSWTTNLKAGDNMMILPIELTEITDGVIQVKVEHRSMNKSFSIAIQGIKAKASVDNTI